MFLDDDTGIDTWQCGRKIVEKILLYSLHYLKDIKCIVNVTEYKTRVGLDLGVHAGAPAPEAIPIFPLSLLYKGYVCKVYEERSSQNCVIII